jgi:superfamily II DNA/RNA helicase
MSSFEQLSFEGLGLGPVLAARLAEAGVVQPAPVQSQAIPVLLAGRDGVIVSPTGTGKTLAYLLPVLQRLDAARRETQAIILAPTQELAMQIVREAERYGAALGVRSAALIGGASLARQLERMKSKPALVVGTPGRVREVAARGKLRLTAVHFVVVDETDRLFSLGGREDAEWILQRCARDRQTVFVSATRSETMRQAEKKWLKQPWVGDAGAEAASDADRAGASGGGLPDTIEHWYMVCDKRDKIDLVRRLLLHVRLKPALLFLNDIEKIGELQAKLAYEGIAVETLYGDISGRERGQALQRFRSGRISVLIATDVAARGLDVPGLPLVIQFDPALDADHYVHRAGRTGRMGNKGVSVTIVTAQERFIIDKLASRLGIAMHQKTLYGGRVVSPEEAGSRRIRRLEMLNAQIRSGLRPGNSPKAGAVADRRGAVKPGSDQPGSVGPGLMQSGSVQSSAAKSSPAGVPQAASKRGNSAAKTGRKRERERDRKNKGAPRWLKQKRETGPATD